MTDITNTSKMNPIDHLVDMTLLGTSEAIELSERVGQVELVNSTKLPTRIGYNESDSNYEALGFKFGEVDTNDPLFREAELPEGWSREGSSHAMWSYIVDETGQKRVAIFYKAAFYDRDAAMYIEKDDAA